MRKRKNKRNPERSDAGTVRAVVLDTSIQENDPLTAVPAKPYAFELVDEQGTPIDIEWIEQRLEDIPRATLDETSGAYLDHVICAAVGRALASLESQRKGHDGHIPGIIRSEQREGDVARDISRALEDRLGKLEAAKAKTAAITAKEAHHGQR